MNAQLIEKILEQYKRGLLTTQEARQEITEQYYKWLVSTQKEDN